MNRRSFVGQLSAGLALQAVPASLMASPISFVSPNRQSVSWTDKAAEIIRGGSLGTPQRLTISHVYSPELISLPTLRAMARKDFDMVGRLFGTDLVIDQNTLFVESPSSLFGSYSTCFSQAGMSLTWQGLARTGSGAAEPTSTLRIMGSQGVLKIALEEGSYQLINLRGQLVRVDHGAGSLLNGATYQGSFGDKGAFL